MSDGINQEAVEFVKQVVATRIAMAKDIETLQQQTSELQELMKRRRRDK